MLFKIKLSSYNHFNLTKLNAVQNFAVQTHKTYWTTLRLKN